MSLTSLAYLCAKNSGSGNLCFLATGSEGLIILDVTTPAEPRLLGTYDTPGSAFDVKVEDNYAYVGEGGYGFIILDISDPTQPVEVGYSNQPLRAEKIEVENGIVFIPEIYMLEIYDCRPLFNSVSDQKSLPVTYNILQAYPIPSTLLPP